MNNTDSPTSQDLEHLQMLSTFHFIIAALAGLFSLLPVIHLAFGMVMIGGGIVGAFAEGPESLVFSAMGCLFTLLPLAIISAGLTYAYFMVKAGRSLVAHENHKLCVVMAAISCAFTPFGTVLGVLTLIVLMRPPVQALFVQQRPAIEPTTAASA